MSKFSVAFRGRRCSGQIERFFSSAIHPIPENDEWWGRGFTEWTNATKAVPQFQDTISRTCRPTSDSMTCVCANPHDQIEMAKEYGIDGFCYHYYWFSGKRILNAPVDDMLADPQSDMPSACVGPMRIGPAGGWLSRPDLIAQKYRPEDDLEFIKDLVPFFRDPRYIQLDGAPFLIVYQPQHLPGCEADGANLERLLLRAGISKIHLCCALTHGNWDYKQFGFDSGVHFPPNNDVADNLSREMKVEEGSRVASSIIRRWPTSIWLKKMGRTTYSGLSFRHGTTRLAGADALLLALMVRRKTTNIGYQNRLGGRARNFPGRIASYSSTLGMNGPKAAISSLAGGMVSAFLRRRSTPSTAGPIRFVPHVGIPAESLAKPPPTFAEDAAAWVLRHLKLRPKLALDRERWAKRLQNMIRNMRVERERQSE